MRATEFTQPGSAGCIIVAADTGRWCLQQRSNTVTDPGVWSTWGGGSEPGETLPQTVRRELAEESGYTGPVQLELVDSRPEYATFVALVPHEFDPQINSESQDWGWFEPGQLPKPLHPGLAQVVSTQLQENRSFNRCYDRACQLYDRAAAKGVDATLLQVANYQGDGSAADARWQRLPQRVWQHYVTVIGDTVYDPTAEQFGAGRPKKYSVDELKSQWGKIYTIRSTAVNENFADGKIKGRSRPGRVKRAGASCKGSVTDLRARAKKYSGERAKMYHWCANMKSGRNKNK
jgi:8-oxo-dGTP pyrophosphatase MutT (NUDIX family)